MKRWLEAPVQNPDGTMMENTTGSPQGSVVSPLLANLFLHYAFDKWMDINFPDVEFERFADDSVIHCATKHQAEELLRCVNQRMQQVKLELNLEKTQIVYCKNGMRKQNWGIISFTFLGYTFRPRKSKNSNNKLFLGFDLGISNKAKQNIRSEIRQLKLHKRTLTGIESLAKLLNPKLRGWINYFGKFRPNLLKVIWRELNERLFKWASKSYKRFKRSISKERKWIKSIHQTKPQLFAHWAHGVSP